MLVSSDGHPMLGYLLYSLCSKLNSFIRYKLVRFPFNIRGCTCIFSLFNELLNTSMINSESMYNSRCSSDVDGHHTAEETSPSRTEMVPHILKVLDNNLNLTVGLSFPAVMKIRTYSLEKYHVANTFDTENIPTAPKRHNYKAPNPEIVQVHKSRIPVKRKERSRRAPISTRIIAIISKRIPINPYKFGYAGPFCISIGIENNDTNVWQHVFTTHPEKEGNTLVLKRFTDTATTCSKQERKDTAELLKQDRTRE